ncbi:MAG: S8 family serine peptidase [Sediminibacterium sp.]|nr:S8 family serine peptidase [Sediminibacterium sp.]
MKKFSLFILSGLILINTCILAQSVYKDYTDGEIYVKFRTGTLQYLKGSDPQNISVSRIKALEGILSHGITNIQKPFYQADDDVTLQHILKVRFSDAVAVDAIIETLKRQGDIEYVEKVPLNLTTLTPNDPQFGSQWHLTKINATNAWNVFAGNSNITVAVVDNAVNITHPDLNPNVWVNPGEIAANGIDDDNNGYIDDVNGWDAADNDNNPNPPTNGMDHGTHCAGIVGARSNNNTGIAAIGFNVKLIGVKCQVNTGSNTGIANGYGGIIYAAKVRARVISCSWGSAGSSAAEQSVINYAWNKGCIIIAAAGNNGVSTTFYPAGYNNVYAVASTGTTDVKSGFSNYGAWVDISSPGENILSTLPGNNYGNNSGTSMAAPLVSGLAGLMLSKNPAMTQTAVLNCISSTAVNIYSVNSGTLAGQLGAGRIDAFAAMNCANATLGNAPVANFYTLTRNVCPGFNVQFMDSSLYAYAPASYTWSFQGGMPAVSNATNPIVSWGAPGTYSVSLTIGTANGTNSTSKTAYITVINPVNLPLSEGFQGTAFLPPNWTPYNIDQDNVFWTRKTGVGGFGTSTVCAMFDNYNLDAVNTRDEIRTPRYNFSSVAQASLSFDVAFAQYDNTYSDTLEVRLSTDCGSTWNSIYLKGGSALATAPNVTASQFTPTATQWRKEGINLSTYAGQSSVMVAFVNRGHYGQALYLDNVNITFTAAATPTANFSSPANACTGATVNYTNTSSGATSYTWTFQGGNPGTSNAASPSVSYAMAGVYSSTLVASGSNGTNAIVKTITISTVPSLSINAAPASVCSGQSTTLTASGASSYTWSTGSNANPLVLSPVSTSAYTLTGSNGICLATGTIALTVYPAPMASVSGTNASCSACSDGSLSASASGGSSPYTYLWQPGNTTSSFLNNVTPGCYTVNVTDMNGCTTSTTNCISFSNGINTLSAALPITIYPNPAHSSIFVHNSGLVDYSLTLYDNIGRLVYELQTHDALIEIPVTQLAKGIYLIKINQNGSVPLVRRQIIH